MRWLRRLLGIPPAPVQQYDETRNFDPEVRDWLAKNPPITARDIEEDRRQAAERRRRNEEADRRRRQDDERRRSDDDFLLGGYGPAIYPAIADTTPAKAYSTAGHDHRDHTPVHSHTTHHETPTVHHDTGGSYGVDTGGGCSGE